MSGYHPTPQETAHDVPAAQDKGKLDLGALAIGDLEAYEAAALEASNTVFARNVLSKDAIFKNLLNPTVNVDQQHIFNVELSKESKKIGPVTSQNATGRCWMFSAANRLRVSIAKKLGVDSFQLSMAYLAFYDKLEKANFFLEQMIKLKDEPIDSRIVAWFLATPAPDGGRHGVFASLVEKYGVIPAALFPDSHSAGNTDSINAILSSKLRAYALELREADVHIVQKRREEMMLDVYRTLTIAYRVPPRPDQQVEWQYYNKNGEYKEWSGTPKMFYEEHKEVEHFSLVHDPRHEYETMQVFPYMRQMVGGKMPTHVNMPIDQLSEHVVAAIKADRPVNFTCDDVIAARFCSKDSGLMDVNLYDMTPFGVAYDYGMDKKQRLLSRDGYAAHSMLITAVHLDKDGKPVRYKVENSLGENFGRKGYYTMTQEWFEKYVYEVVVPRDMATPRQLEVLENKDGREVAELPPWDVLA